MGTGGTCEFSLDPTTRDGKELLGSEELDENGEWRCHRTVDAEERYCPFHRDDVPEAELKAAFLAVFRREETGVEDRQRRKQFVGARFGTLDLRHELLATDDSYPIDLRYAEFDGDVRLDEANLHEKLLLDGGTCHGTLSFTDTVFTREVTAAGVTVDGTVDLRDSTFQARVSFSDASVGRMLGRDARFRGRAVFRRLSARELDFANAAFRDAAYFDKGQVDEAVRFSTVTAEGEVLLADLTVDGDCNVWDATFEEQVVCNGMTITGEAMFADVTCEAAASFDGVTIGDSATFEGARFEGDCTVTDLSQTDGEPPRTVTFRDTEITSGTVVPPKGTVFDLTGATVGPVDFCDGGQVRLDRLRLVDVRFDGFDFRDRAIRDALSGADWRIHETIGDGAEPSAADLESTYLKAKNGAGIVGDDKAAGEFFIRELIFRRHSYYDRLADSSPVTAGRLLSRAAGNRLFQFVAGYGERPWRVVANSGLVVVLFAAVFWAAWPTDEPPYGEPLGFLVLSVESFVTLLLGGAVRVDSAPVRLLAELEGFLGGFLVALFVFTLTRSIHR